MLKYWLLLLIPSIQLQAQTSSSCILKDPTVTINFGAGDVAEVNMSSSYSYRRVESTCPTDGHYAYTPSTSDCFRGDWITLSEDHTPGDNSGNMLLVNASYESGEFFSTDVRGLNPGKKYEFAVWMLNVCRPTDKCPFPLLPNIRIQLVTPDGKTAARFTTGDLPRYGRAQWTRYSSMFDMPAGVSRLTIVMINQAPGGCGNDFALDDITFRECVPPPPPVVTAKKNNPPAKINPPKKDATVTKPAVKKTQPVTSKKPPASAPPKNETVTSPARSNTIKADSIAEPLRINKPPVAVMPPAPAILTSRTNSLVKRIETTAGQIRIDLYDNGEIDGDTVSVYHNNNLIVSRTRLSEKPITFQIAINPNEPHHELVMVANNLGSIPPNTSLMIVTAGSKQYKLFISSSEQNNAKVVFDLKE
jgi:hypothetical protein